MVNLFHHGYYFPAKKKKKRTGLDSAVGVEVEVGVEFTFVLHLPHVMLHHIWDYKERSCQVIKVCMKVCCSLNMFFTESSREQRWKSIVTLWPEFTKQYSIHPALNVQYIVQPFLFRKLFTYSTIIKLRTVSFLLISSSVLGLKRQ